MTQEVIPQNQKYLELEMKIKGGFAFSINAKINSLAIDVRQVVWQRNTFIIPFTIFTHVSPDFLILEPQFNLDKRIRDNINQYNLKHKNKKGVTPDKIRMIIPPRQVTLPNVTTNHTEIDIEDNGLMKGVDDIYGGYMDTVYIHMNMIFKSIIRNQEMDMICHKQRFACG